MKKSLYDILKIKKNSTEKEIKDAYRTAAKENHPDKGGDKEKFQEIAKAYSILGNENKKKRYDETGEENPEREFETRFMALVNQIFVNLIQSKDVDHDDLIGEFRKNLINTEKNFHAHKEEQKKQIEKLNKVKKRLKTKGNQTIVVLIDGHITQAENNIRELDGEIDFFIKVMAVMEDYNYDFDKAVEFGYYTDGDPAWAEMAEKLYEQSIRNERKGRGPW